MAADFTRMSPVARARARGCRPGIPCIEASEFTRGLEAFHRGADLDEDMPIAWRNGWRAGQAGRKPEKAIKDQPLWAWMQHEPDRRFNRGGRKRKEVV